MGSRKRFGQKQTHSGSFRSATQCICTLGNYTTADAGGAFLCYEGFEKIAHALKSNKEQEKNDHQQTFSALADSSIDFVDFEKKKIKGAIRTDSILSAEIVVIALGIVKDAAFLQQVIVVSLIAAVITIGVYGTVAAIVKLDDAGMYLLKTDSTGLVGNIKKGFGQSILNMCPYLMKTLSIVGTAAMFLVGGGILIHGIPNSHAILHSLNETLASTPIVENIPQFVNTNIYNALVGIAAGAIVVFAVDILKKFRSEK
ncbi:MAG: putative DNA repair protein MutK [Oceanicoccus sp.]